MKEEEQNAVDVVNADDATADGNGDAALESAAAAEGEAQQTLEDAKNEEVPTEATGQALLAEALATINANKSKRPAADQTVRLLPSPLSPVPTPPAALA